MKWRVKILEMVASGDDYAGESLRFQHFAPFRDGFLCLCYPEHVRAKPLYTPCSSILIDTRP